MHAEHLLFFLDEIDELKVYLDEARQPAFVAAAGVLALGLIVALATRSGALGGVSIVLLTWTGLLARMLLAAPTARSASTPCHARAKRR